MKIINEHYLLQMRLLLTFIGQFDIFNHQASRVCNGSEVCTSAKQLVWRPMTSILRGLSSRIETVVRMKKRYKIYEDSIWRFHYIRFPPSLPLSNIENWERHLYVLELLLLWMLEKVKVSTLFNDFHYGFCNGCIIFYKDGAE